MRRKCVMNGHHYTVDIVHDIVIPEPQNEIASGTQIVAAYFVLGHRVRVTMGFAIDLDDDPLFVTGEVRKVRTDRRLSPEM